MTVSTTATSIGYAGDNTTTVFSVPFPFIDEANLVVIRRVVSTGAETVLVLNVDYTVTITGGGATGVVTTTVAPTASQSLTISRDVPATQEAAFVANDPLPAESIEDALDKLTLVAQQNEANIARAPRLYESDTDGSGRFNSRGNRYANAAAAVDPTDLPTYGQILAAIGTPFDGPFVLTFTSPLTTGVELYTGVGFQPRAIAVIAVVNDATKAQFSVCFVDANSNEGGASVSVNAGAGQSRAASSAGFAWNIIDPATGNALARATVSSFDPDGISFSISDASVACRVTVLCFQ